ncbi:aldehyde dehydrogenase family protein (plasmid) [Microvirga sp. RSM25]|uniref:aldehyde dehydrogenase family protein n=1 Tax=Microvirga sp. RSM25 TaxID=3273802 RepID=UPI00384FE88B
MTGIPYTEPKFTPEHRAFIADEWIECEATLPVDDLATGEQLVDVAVCSTDLVDQAVTSARNAFLRWRGHTPVARGKILRSWAVLKRTHAEDLAVLMTSEQSKPSSEAAARSFIRQRAWTGSLRTDCSKPAPCRSPAPASSTRQSRISASSPSTSGIAPA